MNKIIITIRKAIKPRGIKYSGWTIKEKLNSVLFIKISSNPWPILPKINDHGASPNKVVKKNFLLFAPRPAKMRFCMKKGAAGTIRIYVINSKSFLLK